ncbi:MAG: hypothetical protein ACPG5T_03970, partial [Endozoicomonas sp.]
MPLAPEAIVHQDGTTKKMRSSASCDVKREHPHLKLLILLDGLFADAPTIKLIRKYGWNFIIIA